MQASLWEKLESKHKGSNSILLNDFVSPYDIEYLYWHSDVIVVAKSVSYFANTYLSFIRMRKSFHYIMSDNKVKSNFTYFV